MRWRYSRSEGNGEWLHLLLVAAALAIPLLLFGVVAYLDRGAVLASAEVEVVATTDVLEAHALNVFETHELIARAVDARIRSMSWDEIGSSQALHDYLNEIERRYPQLLGIWLADPAGKLRNSSRVFPVPLVDLSDRDYFIALKEADRGTFISHVVTGRVQAEKNFNIVRRRSSASGAFDGVIVVSVSPSYFIDYWRKTAPPLNMIAGLLRSDLNILAREPPYPADSLPANSATAAAITRSDYGSVRTVSAIDGVERLMAYRRVGSYDVFIVHGVGVSAALVPWYRHLAIYGAFFGVAGIALLLISLLAFKRMRQWRAATMQVIAEGEMRRAAERQLHQAEKLEAIGQLTGQFAHDFGNVLSAIVLHLQPLREEGDPRIASGLRAAILAAKEGQKAVRSILGFVRPEPRHTEIVAIGRALAEFEVLLRQALGSQSRLDFAVPPDTWPVRADPIQLELALLNLTVNARDAMPEGGTLRIAAYNLHAEGEPKGLAGDFVAVSVSDTGTGIAPELLEKVFDPFFTTKSAENGTGLGLSQVNSFAAGCGGATTIESAPGRGTTVTMNLPRAQDFAVETTDSGGKDERLEMRA